MEEERAAYRPPFLKARPLLSLLFEGVLVGGRRARLADRAKRGLLGAARCRQRSGARLPGKGVFLQQVEEFDGFFVAFFFATLAPTSNLVILIGAIMAERFLYLPSIGFAGCLAWAGWAV